MGESLTFLAEGFERERLGTERLREMMIYN